MRTGLALAAGKAQFSPRCLHPDGLNSRTDEQLAEAFRLFTHCKPKLVSDEETRRTRGLC